MKCVGTSFNGEAPACLRTVGHQAHWGNRVEIVGYDNVQFTKAPNVLRGMGLSHLAKNERAKKELAEKGMAVGQD